MAQSDGWSLSKLHLPQETEVLMIRSTAVALMSLWCAATAQVDLTGIVSDQIGNPLEGVAVHLVRKDLSAQTDTSGRYFIADGAVVSRSAGTLALARTVNVRDGALWLSLDEPQHVRVELFDMSGRCVATAADRAFEAGTHSVSAGARNRADALFFLKATVGSQVTTFRYVPFAGKGPSADHSAQGPRSLAKSAVVSDTLRFTKAGYVTEDVAVESYSGTVDVTLDTVGPSRQWWMSTFQNGRSKYMHRDWNVGYIFYVYSDTYNPHPSWVSYMGAKPDVIGGGMARYSDWPRHCGGDLSYPVNAVMPGSMLEIEKATHYAYWVKFSPVDTWVVLGFSTMPNDWKPAGGTFLDGYKAVANDDYNQWYYKMGQRMRWKLGQLGKDHTKVVLRPNWEMNQDTSMRPNFWDNGGWIALYNKMMKNFAENFRAGFGYHVPIIMDVAHGTQGCLKVTQNGPCNEGNLESFLSGDAEGVYDMVGVSFHPGNWNSGTTEQIKKLVYGPWPAPTDPSKSKFFPMMDAVSAARKKGIAVAFTEWSPWNTLDYYTPRGGEAVDAFADFLEENKDIVAFTCGHHPSFVNESYNPYADAAFGTAWKDGVKRHKARFGYVQ